MIELPIDLVIKEIVGAVREKGGVALVAPPGAGKSTRVPVAVLDAIPHSQSVLVLQPRRVAARAVAQRIAEENNWQLGREVGYHVRFDKRYSQNTRIRVVTEGLLTRMLLGDPYLEKDGGIGCVILDEFHERSLHTDLAAAFLRELRQTVRPELKIVAMSATMEGRRIADFFGIPTIEAGGRAFPVDIRYRSGRDEKLEERIASAVEEALSLDGDILVFLPGVGEIERAKSKLAWLESQGISLLALHGSLHAEEQQRVLHRTSSARRVILATNVAETSLTIPGVRIVIDSGLARIASFDPDRGMNRLDLERISKASANQRSGRAGRTAPGVAIRLWPEAEQKHLPDFNLPEIERVDLCAALLAIDAWGAADPRVFGWFEKPDEERLAAAERVLSMLGAVKNGELTSIGKQIAELPAHPRIGRMLLAAAGTPLLEEAVNAAAILSDDDRSNSADLVTARVPYHLAQARDQLWNIARHLRSEKKSAQPNTLAELLLTAYPDRVARRRDNDSYAAVMVGSVGLRIGPEAMTAALAASRLFLALEARHDPRNKKAEALVTRAVPIEEGWLAEMYPDLLREESIAEYSEEREKVEAVRRRYFADLILEEDRFGKVDPESAGQALGRALQPKAKELFLRNEACAQLLARIALVRQVFPNDPWPMLDDAQLGVLITQAAAGKRTRAEATTTHTLIAALKSTLLYPLDRRLEELAPESLEVPSGSPIRLDYPLPTAGSIATPILAVRLQELFGWTQTPRICAGRVPVLLHLLSPGFKPMQITTDLASFWKSAYFEVRKDLRTRYPKHKWPEDPLTATPEAKGRRKQF